jgi:hypothetical protein
MRRAGPRQRPTAQRSFRWEQAPALAAAELGRALPWQKRASSRAGVA